MNQTVESILITTGAILVVIFLWYMGLSITLRILERKYRTPKVRAPKIRAQKSSAPKERMITHIERLTFLEQRVQRLEDERKAS